MGDAAEVRLTGFESQEVLSVSPFTKRIVIKGKVTEGNKQAVLILEKQPFTSDDIPEVFQEAAIPKLLLSNDVYYSLIHFPIIKYSGIKSTLICPASDEIVKKYTPEPCYIVEETPKLYSEVTEPHISKDQTSVQWVYNILDHKSEEDRIIYEDPDPETGFILIPDLKWDGVTLEGLYIQALPHNRSLHTIRDLTSEHLPLLRKIAKQAPDIIASKYNISKHNLLIYFHYLPSFYHIHVHFKLMQQEGNAGTGAERAHLLSTVINNLELCPDYYKRATLPCCLKKSSELLIKLTE